MPSPQTLPADGPPDAAARIPPGAGRPAPWMLALVFALAAWPWLTPLSGGPSTAVQPWLVGAACAVVLGFFAPLRISPWFAGALVAPVVIAWPHAASLLDVAALAGALALIGFAFAFASVATEAQGRMLVAAWWMAALASTVYALLQYFGVAELFAPWVSGADAGTAYANLRQRNQYASLTAIGVAALLWEARRGERVALLVVLAAVLGAGNAASVSRTGLVELGMLAVLVAWWPGRSRAQASVAGAALGGYVFGALALPRLLAAFTGVEGPSLWARVAGTGSCSSRKVLWSNVSDLIAARPWTGWGWGQLDFAHYATLYGGERFCDILDNAHSLPLHVAVELGLPFAIFAAALMGLVMLRARPWSEADSTRQLAWSVVFILGLHSLLEYPLWYAPFQIALGFALGMLWPAAREGGVPRGTQLRSLLPRVAAILVGGLLLIYTAWDYRRVSQVYLAPAARLPAYREDPLRLTRDSKLFRNHADFAELTLTPLTTENAAWTNRMARELLPYTPEPRVIQKIVESALVLHRDDEVAFHLARWKAAFPESYAEWFAERGGTTSK